MGSGGTQHQINFGLLGTEKLYSETRVAVEEPGVHLSISCRARNMSRNIRNEGKTSPTKFEIDIKRSLLEGTYSVLVSYLQHIFFITPIYCRPCVMLMKAPHLSPLFFPKLHRE